MDKSYGRDYDLQEPNKDLGKRPELCYLDAEKGTFYSKVQIGGQARQAQRSDSG
jgi:hypothetical protein